MSANKKGGQINMSDHNQLLPSGLPSLGKVERTKIVHPTEDQLNYFVGDVPLAWLNVRNTTDAIQYYRRHFPWFSSDIQDHLAVDSYRRKMLDDIAQIKQSK
jgi:hypothetical protein